MNTPKGKERETAALVCILALFFLILTASISDKYLTVDESVYITSGYSYLKTGDYRLNTEHPVFAKILYGLPLLALEPVLPTEKPNWQDSLETGNVGANYGFAADFYSENPEQFSQIVLSSRLVAIALAMLTALIAFLWSRELFGKKAAFLSLFLLVLSPTFIAHSRLATLDIAITCFIFTAFYFAYKFTKEKKFHWAFLSALFMSFASLTKFTALIFYPLMLIFIIANSKPIEKIKKRKKYFEKPKKLILPLAVITIFIFLPLLLANILYFSDPYPQPNYYGVIPARLVDGYTFIQNWVSQGRLGYLFGEMHDFMPHYLLAAFLMKSTIPFIVLLFTALALQFKKPNKKTLALLIPALGFFLIVSLFSRFYLGVRYILPALPFLFVFCGSLATKERIEKIKEDKRLLALIAVLLLWHFTTSLLIFPNYLAYFNEFIGPENGAQYLSDSNLDWGQDLILFQKFMEEKGIERINFIYFGWPFYNNRDFPQAYYSPSCEPINESFAISATIMNGRTRDEFECYVWVRELTPTAQIGYSIYYFEKESE